MVRTSIPLSLIHICLRRGEGNKNTAWQLVEDQDENGNGLGSFKWFENTDDPTSMAIAPCVEYKGKVDGIVTAGSDVQQNAKVVSVYTVSGQLTDAPRPVSYTHLDVYKRQE